MSAQQEIFINVVSASSLSPDDEAEMRSAFELAAGNVMLKSLAQAWKAENSGERFTIAMPEGKGVVSESLKFKELEFFKEMLTDAIQMDDDRKMVVRVENEELKSSHVNELYTVLAFLGQLVGGWESDSEFAWENPSVGKSAFFWEGDGQIFPEMDFN